MSELTPLSPREDLVAEVRRLCSDLNNAGADPRWTPTRLHLFINLKYEIDDSPKYQPTGIDAMGGESLVDLIQFLQRELDALQAHNEAEKSIAGNAGRHALERSAAAERSF